MTQPENVVLIHGFGGCSLLLRPLDRHFVAQGYRVRRWAYWSAIYTLDDHARQMREFLEPLADSDERTHFVAHSMGGLILRSAAADLPWKNPGRLVMLGPPNHGSWAARIAAYGLNFACPALSQISTTPGSLVHQLPQPACFETGIIAAKRDCLVSHDSTYLGTEKEHITLNCGHNRLLFHAEAKRQAAHFVKCGQFSRVAV